MKDNVLANILLSMRSQIDAILEDMADEAEKKCEHPKDRQKNMTTMGATKETYLCGDCGTIWEKE